MLRELVSRISSSIAERRASRRKISNVPMRVWFAPDNDGVKQARSWDTTALAGETADLSSTGIAFLVSAIRIRDRYLVGQERTLEIEIEANGRKLRMKAIGRRYEKVDIHVSEERFFVGAEIVSMDEDNRSAYEQFLKQRPNAPNKLPGLAATLPE